MICPKFCHFFFVFIKIHILKMWTVQHILYVLSGDTQYISAPPPSLEQRCRQRKISKPINGHWLGSAICLWFSNQLRTNCTLNTQPQEWSLEEYWVNNNSIFWHTDPDTICEFLLYLVQIYKTKKVKQKQNRRNKCTYFSFLFCKSYHCKGKLFCFLLGWIHTYSVLNWRYLLVISKVNILN